VTGYLPGLDLDDLPRSLEVGYRYLALLRWCGTLEEERGRIREFYRLVFEILIGPMPPPPGMLDELVADQVDAVGCLPFPDAARTILGLRRSGLRVGLLSNAWPSMVVRLKRDRMWELFDAAVVSMRVGLAKPDPAIFHHAATAIGLRAEQLAFVDDYVPNVDVASRLGMHAILIDRSGSVATAHTSIRSLDDLARWLCR